MEEILAEIGDGIMATQQQPHPNKAALNALDQLQALLRERGVDLAGWEQAMKAEWTGKEQSDE